MSQIDFFENHQSIEKDTTYSSNTIFSVDTVDINWSNDELFGAGLYQVSPEFKDSLTYRFYQLIAIIWKCKSTMSPRAFKSSIDSHLKQFNGFKQHDAQEFLTAVLDRLHDEVKSNIVIDKYNLSASSFVK